MPVTPQQHAIHTAGIGATRAAFNLPRLVKSGIDSIETNVKNNFATAKKGIGELAASFKGGVHPFGYDNLSQDKAAKMRQDIQSYKNTH